VFLLNWRRAKAVRILLALSFFVLSVSMRRNLPLFVFVAAPVLVAEIDAFLGESRAGPHRPLLRRLRTLPLFLFVPLTLFLGWALATDRFFIHEKTTRRFGYGVSQYLYSDEAVRFVDEQGIPGPIFNEFGTSSTLLWTLYPEHKVFITENTFRAPIPFYKNYLRVVAGLEDYAGTAGQHGIQAFFLRHTSLSRNHLIPALMKDERWTLIFHDARTVVFLRNDPRHARLLARFSTDLQAREEKAVMQTAITAPTEKSRPDPPWYMAREIPMERFFLGNFYARFGYIHLAEAQYRAAAALAPDCHYGYHGLGFTALAKGNQEAAQANFERVQDLVPGDFESAKALGLIYTRRAERHLTALEMDAFFSASAQGERYLDRALRAVPSSGKASRLLIELYLLRAQANRIMENPAREERDLKLILQVADRNKVEGELRALENRVRLRLGRLLLRRQAHGEAARLFAQVVENAPDHREAFLLGVLSKWMAGDREGARGDLRKAIRGEGAEEIRTRIGTDEDFAPLRADADIRRLLKE
jgi:tetratricopeptide (TPR) repeat protein